MIHSEAKAARLDGVQANGCPPQATMSKLFEPITVGNVRLEHRIAMAPLTRFRCHETTHVPLPNSGKYYAQRASTPGTLIIAEGTQVSARHCSKAHAPGLWTEDQIAGWGKVVEAVHANGCFIFCQLMAPGRAGHKEGYPLYSSSAVPMEEGAPVPVEMTEEDIWDCIGDFAAAARNAMKTGFDGIELHGANGYLIDQFTQNVCNKRTDAWGGSVERRSRFALEIVKAVSEAIGAQRVGIRLSPWNIWQGMKMDDALSQFSHLIRNLKELKPAYLHLVESRVINNIDTEGKESLRFAFDIWQNQSPILIAGGYTPERAKAAVDDDYKDQETIVVFGRLFLATPDLVFRARKGLPLNAYDRDTFYTPVQDEGYVDYPFSKEFLETRSA